MNYFWSFLFIAVSLSAAYNPFFREPVKPKKAPILTSEVRPMPLPPLLKPPLEVDTKPISLSALQYCGFLETEKGRFALVKVSGSTIVLKEADPFYLHNSKYFVRSITSNYITVDDAGKIQSIYFTAGGH